MNKTDYLQAMGVDVWVDKKTKVKAIAEEQTPELESNTSSRGLTAGSRKSDELLDPAVKPRDDEAENINLLNSAHSGEKEKKNDWSSLKEEALTCTACGLDQTRTHVVFGVGNQQADIMFIGEAPGAQEDKQGEPFVGRAGQLLTSMLKAIGLQREDVYIANILKCRPQSNRDPKPEEVALCTPFLTQQIALIQPKVIVALGGTSAHYLLNTSSPLGEMRERALTYGEQNTPLVVTYHPAYLLRSLTEKRKAWQDLLRIKQYLT